MSHEINIGILALQGDIEENTVATKKAMSSLSLNAYTTPVRYQKELESVDGLIIPGGESTCNRESYNINVRRTDNFAKKTDTGNACNGYLRRDDCDGQESI